MLSTLFGALPAKDAMVTGRGNVLHYFGPMRILGPSGKENGLLRAVGAREGQRVRHGGRTQRPARFSTMVTVFGGFWAVASPRKLIFSDWEKHAGVVFGPVGILRAPFTLFVSRGGWNKQAWGLGAQECGMTFEGLPPLG